MSSVKLGVGGNPAGSVNQQNNRRDPETRNTGRQNQRQVQIVTGSHGRSDVRSNLQHSNHNRKQIDEDGPIPVYDYTGPYLRIDDECDDFLQLLTDAGIGVAIHRGERGTQIQVANEDLHPTYRLLHQWGSKVGNKFVRNDYPFRGKRRRRNDRI